MVPPFEGEWDKHFELCMNFLRKNAEYWRMVAYFGNFSEIQLKIYAAKMIVGQLEKGRKRYGIFETFG
jgi:hypothetical protein